MQVTAKLQSQLQQAVRVSMRIEGYRPSTEPKLLPQVKALMEQQRVQVSVPSK